MRNKNFIKNIGQIFDISNSYVLFNRKHLISSSLQCDKKNLEQDWINVGEDIGSALDNGKKQETK